MSKCFTRPTRSLTAAQKFFDAMQHTHEDHPYAVIIYTGDRIIVCEFVAYGAASAVQALDEWKQNFVGCSCSAVRMGSEVHLIARTASRCGAASIANMMYRNEMEALEDEVLPNVRNDEPDAYEVEMAERAAGWDSDS